MKKFDSHRWIKTRKLNAILKEADVFDTNDAPAGAEGDDGPTSNRAVKKFELLIKEKSPWDKVRQLVPEMSDQKQVEFGMYMLADLKMTDTAKKKLKIKL